MQYAVAYNVDIRYVKYAPPMYCLIMAHSLPLRYWIVLN